MEPIIRAEQLYYSYPPVREKDHGAVIRNLNFTVGSGSIMGIAGPSGCGKSTLLKLLGGFLAPDSGTLLLDGQPVTAPGPDRVMVFQEFDQLMPWLTVTGNLRFPLRRVAGISRRETVPLIEEALELTGLLDAGDRLPFQLSGGMKQRASIARAMVLKPRVLLMDEPFGSLDFSLRGELQCLVRRIAINTGTTIIFVTHDIPEVIAVADTALVFPKSGEGCTLIGIADTDRTPESPLYRRMLSEITGSFFANLQ